MKDLVDESDDILRQRIAMKVLAEVLTKGQEYLGYFYEEYSSMESIEEICRKAKKTQPRIVALLGEEATQHFVTCECQVLCKVETMNIAIFIGFASYYCFNLLYPPPAKNFFNFLQDYVLNHPDSSKKLASYLATVSDIKHCL